ncbi:MAG: hypothetical protein CW346_14050 [Bacillaceae bacterium]|nr:hypothetical protein [Bacillaceae bacterium]
MGIVQRTIPSGREDGGFRKFAVSSRGFTGKAAKKRRPPTGVPFLFFRDASSRYGNPVLVFSENIVRQRNFLLNFLRKKPQSKRDSETGSPSLFPGSVRSERKDVYPRLVSGGTFSRIRPS